MNHEDAYLNVVDANTTITHIGWRPVFGRTDLVVGFKATGKDFDKFTRVEFVLGEGMDSPREKIKNFWVPNLRNTQGFKQQARSPHQTGSEFVWPERFEPIDDLYIHEGYLSGLSVDEKGVYLAFCSVPYILDRFTLYALTSPTG